jgi:hypothetical protein
MGQKPPLIPSDLYRVAVNQRRLLWTILFALLGYAALFAVDAAFSTTEYVPVPPELRDRFEGDVMEVSVLTDTGWILILCLGLVFLGLAIAWVVVVISLLSALRVNIFLKILAILGSFVPLLSLLILLLISSRATRVLKGAGYKVSLLGVNAETLARMRADAS